MTTISTTRTSASLSPAITAATTAATTPGVITPTTAVAVTPVAVGPSAQQQPASEPSSTPPRTSITATQSTAVASGSMPLVQPTALRPESAGAAEQHNQQQQHVAVMRVTPTTVASVSAAAPEQPLSSSPTTAASSSTSMAISHHDDESAAAGDYAPVAQVTSAPSTSTRDDDGDARMQIGEKQQQHDGQERRSAEGAPASSTAAAAGSSSGATTTAQATGAGGGIGGSPTSSPTSSSSSSSSSPSSSPSAHHHTQRRVKVYQLQDDLWIDLGTGNCSGIYIDELAPKPAALADITDIDDGAWLVVRRESPAKTAASSAANNNSSDDSPKREAKVPEGREGDVLLKTKVIPFPPGYNPDDDEDDELAAAAASGGASGAAAEEALARQAERDPGGYKRQQDTLIVWSDCQSGNEMALSFASVSGCTDIWSFIQASRRWTTDQLVNSPSPSPTSSSPQHAFAYFSHAGPAPILPEPSLANLDALEHCIRQHSRTAHMRERTAREIIRRHVVERLIEIHSEAEDLEALDDLHKICRVFQSILLLNDNFIFEHILRDDVILGAVSLLEYDPEFPTMKASYRAHLADQSHFREVVPIKSKKLLNRIHQTHRLYYLKDVVLARVVEDPTFGILNSLVYFNEVEIVNDIAGSREFLRALFRIFDDDYIPLELLKDSSDKGKAPADSSAIGPQLPPSPPSTNASKAQIAAAVARKRDDAILLLQQLCGMAKSLQMVMRPQFYRALAEAGFLRVLEVALARVRRTKPVNEDETTSAAEAAPTSSSAKAVEEEPQRDEKLMRSATIELLMLIVDHAPNDVRAYSLRQFALLNEADHEPPEGSPRKDAAVKKPLAMMLVELFLEERDGGFMTQMAEALRILVEANAGDGMPEGPAARLRQEDPEAERFLQYFYDHCVDKLYAPIINLPASAPDAPLELSRTQVTLFAHLCDLLCYFIPHHTFRSKFFVLSGPIAPKVASLIGRTRHKFLTLAAIRVFRACIARNDDFYNRFLIKNDLLGSILDVAVAESAVDNLVVSVCLDFFEHIRTGTSKALVNYLLEKHADKIDELASRGLPTFAGLRSKWEQINEPPPAPVVAQTSVEPTSTSMARTPSSGWGRMDADEEAYFTQDDEEDQLATPTDSAPPGSLKRPSTSGEPEPAKRARLSHPRQGLVDYGEDENGREGDTAAADDPLAGGFLREDEDTKFASPEISLAADDNDEELQRIIAAKKEREASDKDDEDGLSLLASKPRTQQGLASHKTTPRPSKTDDAPPSSKPAPLKLSFSSKAS